MNWICCLLLLLLAHTNNAFLSTTRRQPCLRYNPTSKSSLSMSGDGRRRIPFIIDRLESNIKNEDNAEISDLVINVFFEEEAERKIKTPSTPWKSLQLKYLRNLHFGEVKSKKFVLDGENDMFIAREVVAAPTDSVDLDQTVDLTRVFNSDELVNTGSSQNFIRGQLLGFVDVTEKRFGLAEGMDGDDDYQPLIGFDEDTTIASGESTPMRRKSSYKRPLRAVLTNLAVKQEARFSGVGSQLVQACEDIVSTKWENKKGEMILEVEEDNDTAQRFYEKRGYKAQFADPTSRRYDTSGLLLQSVRTTKICYKKVLKKESPIAPKPPKFFMDFVDSFMKVR